MSDFVFGVLAVAFVIYTWQKVSFWMMLMPDSKRKRKKEVDGFDWNRKN